MMVTPDSIWTWDAEPQANLAMGIRKRGGSIKIGVSSLKGLDHLEDRPGLLDWVDENRDTAWGPDDEGDLQRQVDVYIDLGATFRVNRIHFSPRLDREHRDMILGAFEMATNEGTAPPEKMAGVEYSLAFAFPRAFPNREPIIDMQIDTRNVRYIRLRSQEIDPWEIAELEIYSDGTVPPGNFVSRPLFVRGGFPIWGRVIVNGTEASEVFVVIQTRTGPDPEPDHYFLQSGDILRRVSREVYLALDRETSPIAGLIKGTTQGPVKPNPAWSSWQTVTDGQVLSPGPRRYLQFRIFLSEPGTVVKQLVFEYVRQPVADDLAAEIDPLAVEAGQETDFTLSMEVHLDESRGETGVRYIQVLTPAAVSLVEQVKIDDQDEVFTATYQAGVGFSVDLWRHILQSGSFIQIMFRATVLRDGTPFQVRALDLRPDQEEIETVYQTAQEEDVDPLSLGGSLVVRLSSASPPLVEVVNPRGITFTPNADGTNDFFEISYNLLRLLRPTPVFFEIFDLQGRRVRQGYAGADLSGQFTRIWDGRDDRAGLVVPGIYLYQIEVKADAGIERRQGVVQVAY